MKHDWTSAEAWGRIGAALLGSTALYLAFCIVLATSLPLTQDVGLALGILGGFPVWIGSACYAVLARSVVRAGLVLVAAAVLLSGWAWFVLSFQ